ncbi:MAG: hypothetical protein KDI36_17830, partial [Pseudomonadales bacterium]|nr:hypothetical protein [Pseudomonadales bacterium]
MKGYQVVFRKEVLDGLRDKRALMSALIFPLLAPFLVLFLVTTMIDMRTSDDDLQIAVIGADNAPHLIDWLEEKGLKFREFGGNAEEDAETAVSHQLEEMILIIPPAFTGQ